MQKIIVGLVEARTTDIPNDFELSKCKAYVKAVAVADSSSEFVALVKQRLESMGLEFVGAEEIRPVAPSGCPDDEIARKAGELDSQNDVAFFSFHIFSDEGEDGGL